MLKEHEFEKLVRRAIRRGPSHYEEGLAKFVKTWAELLPEYGEVTYKENAKSMREVFSMRTDQDWIHAFYSLDTFLREEVLRIIVEGEPGLEEANDSRHGGYWVRGLSGKRW